VQKHIFISFLVFSHLVIAQDLQLVANAYDQWKNACDVAIVGDIAYVATGVSGLKVMDISDVEDPRIIGSFGGYVRLIDIAGDMLISQPGILMISIADPENPELLGTIEDRDPYVFSEISVSGDYAFIPEVEKDPEVNYLDGGFRVYNISDPEAPGEVGFYHTGPTKVIRIVGNIAFVVGGSYLDGNEYVGDDLFIYSINDLENLELIASHGIEGGIEDVVISGDIAYVTSPGRGLLILDISDPENPQEIGMMDALGFVRESIVVDEYLYIAWSDGEYQYDDEFGVKIISVSDPENPVELRNYSTPDTPMSVSINNDYVFVACDMRGLRILSIEEPDQLVEVGVYDTPDNINGIALGNDYVFVTDGSTGLRILSISDLGNFGEIGQFNTEGYAFDVEVSGDYAYIAGGSEGLRIISILDPGDPIEIGHADVQEYATCVSIWGEFAFVGDRYEGMRVITISDPRNPEEFDFVETPGFEWVYDIEISGDYAYLANDDNGLRIISLEDIFNIREVGSCETWGSARGVAVSGEYAFVADGHQGLSVISIVDPGNPQRMRLSETISHIYDVEIEGNYAFVGADRHLAVISIANPENLEVISSIDVPRIVRDVEISDDGLIYAAYHGSRRGQQSNVGIYRFTQNGIEGNLVEIPTTFTLYSAYPNPFNSTTTIEYTLPFASEVTLNIYNLSGQRVETLVIGRMEAGVHRVMLDAGDMASGLYFVKMEGVGRSVTQKIMLVK